METEFLNFRDEEHFSDFSLSLEQSLVEKPQDLLMHMVENDFDYMETHLDITNSDGLWTNHECVDDMGEISPLENSSISKLDSIKEDFAKVLTDWQEHIGYLQASDMDEYMDIIGYNINTTDKKNFCTSENMFEDQLIHTIESDVPVLKEENSGKDSLHTSHNILDLENKFVAKKMSNIEDFIEDNNKTVDVETESLLREPKFSKTQNKVKKNVSKCKNIGIDINATQKKKKKEKQLHYNKETHNNDSNSDKYPVNQLPVLQAGDVKSLLEQFEASENTMSFYPSCSTDRECNQKVHVKSNETQSYMKQSQTFTTKKSLSRISNLHKNIKSALPKEMVEKIKTTSANKKEISIISTIPNAQSNGRSNGTRMQDAAVTLFRNKLLKAVTNDTKNKIINGGLIQLDHDYCSTNSSISNSNSNKYEKRSVSSHLTKNVIKSKECLSENNLKKDSGLESGETSDNSEQSASTISGVQINESVKQLQNTVKECQKEISLKQENHQHTDITTTNKLNFVSKVQNKSANTPKHETKIQSTLAASILQMQQQDALSKTESITTGSQKVKQMVSVLKKPLNVQQLPVLMTASNESVVTTTNSLNDKVQNIIVQTNEETCIQENNKKPPRKKLNLAEYRSRREQNRSDNSRTNSPVPPMTLIYIHHASTTTEPIKDDLENVIWSEREIVSLLKPKADIDEKKVLPKPSTCDIGIQTYETVFEFPQNSLTGIDEREKSIRDENQQPCKKQRINSSSSRSRSRSNSRSKSRSRSRSSSNRSRSYKRNNTRHRRISHRRSSVSSSSSWSSRSRSNTRSSLSSESRYSRSRSRLSRSRSRSSSRYSSCSRSSSRSNFTRNRWLRRKRRQGKKYHRSYDRDSQYSKSSYRDYEDWRRSPSNSYRRPYDHWYDREKQRQVEERRVIYVGRLDEGITKTDLRRRFEIFGPVVDISVHFREHGDNYGFVTFAYKNDAYEAVEHGNDNPTLPRYDLCFGGRRAFCKVKYADLDGIASDSFSSEIQSNEDNTFDLLLKEAKAKLRKRKV